MLQNQGLICQLVPTCLYRAFNVSLTCLGVLKEVEASTPSIFLVSLNADELKMITGRAADAARLWLLVAWIPDDSKAR